MRKIIDQMYEERLKEINEAWSYSGAIISPPQRRQISIRAGTGHTRKFIRGASLDAILKYPKESILVYADCEFPQTIHDEKGYIDEYLMLNKDWDEAWLNLEDLVLISEKWDSHYFIMTLADDYLFSNRKVRGRWVNVVSINRSQEGQKPVVMSMNDDVHVLFTKVTSITYARKEPLDISGHKPNEYPKVVRIKSSYDCDDMFVLSRCLFNYGQASPNYGWFVTPNRQTYVLEHVPTDLYLLMRLDPEVYYYSRIDIAPILNPHICDPKRRDCSEMKQFFSQEAKPVYVLVGIYVLMSKAMAAHFISRRLESVNDIVLFVFAKGGVTKDGVVFADVTKGGIMKFYYVPFLVEHITPKLIRQFQDILSTPKYTDKLMYNGVGTHVKYIMPEYKIPPRAVIFPYRYPLGIFYEGYVSRAHPISRLLRSSRHHIHDVPDLNLKEVSMDGYINEDMLSLQLTVCSIQGGY